MMTQPKGLTSASGIDALTHALEAYASIMATDYTDGLALKAMKSIFEYLPSAYENGANDPYAREKMADASCMQVWLCKRIPGCMPFDGTQTGCISSPATWCCKRTDDFLCSEIQRRRSSG